MIKGITARSPADCNGRIKIGDKICTVNDVEISDKVTTDEICDILAVAGDSLSLVLKEGKILHPHK